MPQWVAVNMYQAREYTDHRFHERTGVGAKR